MCGPTVSTEQVTERERERERERESEGERERERAREREREREGEREREPRRQAERLVCHAEGFTSLENPIFRWPPQSR